jgi:hypothetical protein
MSDETKWGFEIARLVIPSVLVVIGWWVVFSIQKKNTSDQEFRKELRAKLDAVHDDIRQLRQNCIDYYVAETPRPDLPVVIRVLTDDIREKSVALSKAIMDKNGLDRVYDTLSDLIGSATGGAFETKKRQPVNIYDPKLNAVFNNGAKLAWTLDRAYQEKYNNSN